MEHNSNGGLHWSSLIVGLAAGVVGTILFATYNKRRFAMATDKVQELTDRSTHYVGDVAHNVRDKASGMIETAADGVKNLGESVKKAVGRGSEA
jgi:hypothetical protein